MSLELHPRCKERLVESIAGQLLNINVKNKMFIERSSCIGLFDIENILPRDMGNLSSYIGEHPLVDFIYETLSRELGEKFGYDSDIPLCKLTEIEEYTETNQLATRLVEQFDSLPWQYTFTIELGADLSKIFHESIGEFKLSERILIRKFDDEFSESFPTMSGLEKRDSDLCENNLLFSLPRNWNQDAAFLQVNSLGFVGRYGVGEVLKEVEEMLKSFCGLGLALRLFKIDSKYRSTPTKSKFYSHQRQDDSWVAFGKHELDYNESDTFHDLVLHDLNGQLDDYEKLSNWVNLRMNDIKVTFSSQNKDITNKLLLACQWLFESCSVKNELLSFVQTTVVIEILLGDKALSEQIGLGTLLRNRCAYLIGTSQTQRDEILADFQEIYDVRSKIVHAGKSRLSSKEMSLLHKLQWMCRRVIQEEVKLLSNEEVGKV
ncbi:hypothetical protein C0W35_16260 [Photobacterium kishitanii]|uniref:HEPN domain-containing protein n=1 Tax=Photobacterium kishitanii TaxID=318456 RepID=UPI000D160CB3|nr:HEPN domain-containing protein [Photobacterium kishitanii]PSU90436.1 hypothetical protein C0W35_16260 [Photobacterium kishitanii]